MHERPEQKPCAQQDEIGHKPNRCHLPQRQRQAGLDRCRQHHRNKYHASRQRNPDAGLGSGAMQGDDQSHKQADAERVKQLRLQNVGQGYAGPFL